MIENGMVVGPYYDVEYCTVCNKATDELFECEGCEELMCEQCLSYHEDECKIEKLDYAPDAEEKVNDTQ